MKRIIIVLIIVLVVVGGGIYLFKDEGLVKGVFTFSPKGSTGSDPYQLEAKEEDIAQIPTYQYTETFAHPVYKFAFKYPADFTITQIPNDDGSEAILIQNVKTKIGVQILVSPFPEEGLVLTEELIKTDIPDLKITDVQELLIGGGGSGKGIAFVSDSEDFGGKSREVWFVYNKRLYQISTYYELDEFLRGIFGTWQFQ